MTPTVSYTYSIESIPPPEFKGFSSSLERLLSECHLARFEIEGIEYQACRAPVFDFWLSSAVAHRVPDITLALDDLSEYSIDSPSHALPVFFFAYPRVASLRLQRCDFSLCHRVSWNSLKVLRVGDVKMTDRLLDIVLNGTPALECLELARCWGMHHIRLCSNKLKELVIDGYADPRFQFSSSPLNDGVDTLVISAPHLLSLQILNVLYGKIKIRLHQVTSLVRATLDFVFLTDKELQRSAAINSSILIEELSHVNNLVIGTWLLMMLAFSWIPQIIYLNCRTLTLGGFLKGWEFLGLICPIRCGRDVEKLVIQFRGDNWPARYDALTFESRVWPWWSLARFWRNHLKTIEINGFRAKPGFLGMKIATYANTRTTQEARKGVGKAFIMAFRSGALMGFLLAASGLVLGYKSVIIPIFAIALAIYVSFSFAAMYGIAMAALGMLSTIATGLLEMDL
ncbi:hypothetical protein MLD38_027745 [Melastoma candidum]|uniref:Uncharacterized protein n=1 Tax=Melastoma candidum TaxID=119954 RepID=A0ACB9P739_9MYRT|nr:hypothetical protein MLD38_027745 [Melastoma candidum]